ncbi:hypothetical protein [Clostridium vitabionis]|jgi:hypothetical protein|uniref:hypothetical protein n=1 Tax=Clostridium vitabionis TaxID=2784388 RepID=UPI00188B7A7B|nr:hypothetical protein [Clostridium vitabionis]
MAKKEELIDFEAELENFQPSLDINGVGEAIVRQDLTDMSDIMLEIMKQMKNG